MTDEEKQPQSQAKMQAAVSFGTTLLGAFLGRKAVQTATMQTPTEDQAPTACPFCGTAELKIKNQAGAFYTIYFVECPECQARGPVATSEEKAKASWIQRANLH